LGGFTLDYGPFGFIDRFDPKYQPWTGGGDHFSFFNQPQAAMQNFYMFCTAVHPLIKSDTMAVEALEKILNGFPEAMQEQVEAMWASKLGLEAFDAELYNELMMLMIKTSVDYTIFFRELSHLPEEITPLLKCFYGDTSNNEELLKRWSVWLEKWQSSIGVTTPEARAKLSEQMKSVNPKYTLREWFLVPAYQAAVKGDYSLIEELQEVMTKPYDEQSKEMEAKYYAKKPTQLFDIAGISHVSCSS
uniref:protein adenylyltransferase SelO family protein n=1 Tax=Sulfurovum sp. TaxID=1969726 RepID=UPI003569CC0C